MGKQIFTKPWWPGLVVGMVVLLLVAEAGHFPVAVQIGLELGLLALAVAWIVFAPGQDQAHCQHKGRVEAVEYEMVCDTLNNTHDIFDKQSRMISDETKKAMQILSASVKMLGDSFQSMSALSTTQQDAVIEILKNFTSADTADWAAGRMTAQHQSDAVDNSEHITMLLDNVAQLNANLNQKIQEVSALTSALARSVTQAVMSLQFEDIVRQMLEHIEKNMIIMAKFSNDIKTICASSLADLKTGEASDDLHGIIARIAECQERYKNIFDKSAASPVSGRALSNNVQLF